MALLLKEIEANFDAFSTQWKAELGAVSAHLANERAYYVSSYIRVASLNAWREALLSGLISSGSLAFFLEAQNDAVISHVLASLGSWRSALKSLRSCIENVCSCLYYKDHPVELELWTAGNHRMDFINLIKYLWRHPELQGVRKSITGLQ